MFVKDNVVPNEELAFLLSPTNEGTETAQDFGEVDKKNPDLLFQSQLLLELQPNTLSGG